MALAGFYKIDITPPLDTITACGLGYWFERRIRFVGVRDPLFVRALALGDGPSCQVIISVDALFDSFGFIDSAQAELSEQLGIPEENIFISCTHTHSAPVVGLNNTNDGCEYGSFVADRIVACVRQAVGKREAVSVSISRDRVSEVIRNRRPVLRNGRVAVLHAALNAAEVADRGPVNDVLTLVKFRRSTGGLVGAICHFGIHGVSIQCSDLISSDCMGRAIQRAERATANEAVMLHLNAPCGDIDPVQMGDAWALDEMTRRLHEAIQKVENAEERPMSVTPQRSTRCKFSVRRRATRPLATLRQEEERLLSTNGNADRSHHSGPGYERFLVEEERAVAKMSERFDIPYQILQSGDLLWIGIGGEVFTCFGLGLLSLDSRFEILVVGVTGANKGYLPPIDAFSQGGYEVAPARWCPIAPGETEGLFKQIEVDARRMTGAAVRCA